MINSKEIILECNLKSSSKNNDNSFTTTIGGGIQLEQGDTITITDVAVNSKGIGGDMIQIPKEQGSLIRTNKLTMKIGKYITSGSRFFLPLPHAAYTINTDITKVSYGFAADATNIDSASLYTAQGTLPYINAALETTFNEFKGGHQYDQTDYNFFNNNPNKSLGIKFHSVVAPRKAQSIPKTSIRPYEITPTKVYSLESDDCNIEIPIGYESPEQIAELITNQFHSGRLEQAQSVIPKILEDNGTNADQRLDNPSITNAFCKIKNANGINTQVSNGKTAANRLIGMYENALYDNIYCRNPKRYINGLNLAMLGKFYTRQDPSKTDDINNPVLQMISYGGGYEPTKTNTYPVLITNLLSQYLQLNTQLADSDEVNNNNMRLLLDFVRNTEVYRPTGLGECDAKPVVDYEKDSKHWMNYMEYGRYNDQTSVDNISNANFLQPNWLKNRDDGSAEITGVGALGKYGFFTRYNEEIYRNKVLPAEKIAEGYYFVEDIINTKNELIVVEDFLIENNMMFCVVSNTKNVDLTDGNYLIAFMPTGYMDLPSDLGCPDGTNVYAGTDITDSTKDIFDFQYFGFDPTFMRNNCGIAINTMKNKGSATAASLKILNYVNYIQTGSPNAQLAYDVNTSRFSFKYLHFPYHFAAAEAVELFRKCVKLVAPPASDTGVHYIPFPAQYTANATILTPFFWGYSGSTILGLEGCIDIDEGHFVNKIAIDTDNFKFTLLSRLGFKYEDLFSIGAPDVLYNSATAGDFVNFPYETPNPITTNAKIITTYDYALGVEYTNLSAAITKPHYDLNVNVNSSTNVNSESCAISASNLPLKLENPYWLIQSNIIPSSNYINNNGKKKNILSVVNRAYTSNDYAYGMGATTSKIVENPIVITEITTNIFNNDFSQPLLDDGCVVVYKITKNYQIENREIKAAIQQEEQKQQKKSK